MKRGVYMCFLYEFWYPIKMWMRFWISNFFLYAERKIHMGFLNFIYREDITWNTWNSGPWVYKYVFSFPVTCNHVSDWSFCVNSFRLFIGLCGGAYHLWTQPHSYNSWKIQRRQRISDFSSGARLQKEWKIQIQSKLYR